MERTTDYFTNDAENCQSGTPAIGRRHGFSLVELLVVIAVIVVLLALSF